MIDKEELNVVRSICETGIECYNKYNQTTSI